MKSCTFFGHRDTPYDIKAKLTEEIVKPITENGVNKFYVGNQGNFDRLVNLVLADLCHKYPHITYYMVLYKIPCENDALENTTSLHSIIPDKIENSHPKFAIDHRNRWMLENSDYVISYVTHSFGGAAKYLRKARRKGKTIINLADSIE